MFTTNTFLILHDYNARDDRHDAKKFIISKKFSKKTWAAAKLYTTYCSEQKNSAMAAKSYTTYSSDYVAGVKKAFHLRTVQQFLFHIFSFNFFNYLHYDVTKHGELNRASCIIFHHDMCR